MSLTSLVPAAVPSDLHGSRPWVGSVAVKKTLPPMSVSSRRLGSPPPGLMSLTSLVPAAVPSDLQSSRPCPGSVQDLQGASHSAPLKKSVPATSVRYRGLAGSLSTSFVPAAVPSDLQSKEAPGGRKYPLSVNKIRPP